jgi:hypothetical protein
MATYEQLKAALDYAHNTNVTAMATGLPVGFGAGFKVTWTAPNEVNVGPGAANVDGVQVSINEVTPIDHRMWLVVRNASTHFYIYLTREGNFEVDITGPIQSVDNDFYNYHPITSARFIGRIFVDSNLDQVFATTGTKAVPEVLVGALAWTDDSDYSCDGTADEAEINAAVNYLADAFSGGIIRLSPGTFTLAAAIVLKSNIMLSGSGRGTILQPDTDTDAITVTGTDGNEILGAGIRDFRIKRTAVLTADCEDVNLDYADRFFANAVEFDADAAIASPDPHEHTVIKADNCDDLFVMSCDLRMAGYGINAVDCSGQILTNTISMSAPADKRFTIGVRIVESPRFVVTGNTISNLLNSRPGQIELEAIYVAFSKNSSIKNNTVENIRAIAQTDASSSSSGISTAGGLGGSAAEITGNLIRDVHDWHTSITGAPGIVVHSNTDDASIAGNHIEHADTGIRIDHSSCERTSVSGNFVTNCGQLIDYGNCEDANEPMVLGETVPHLASATFARSAAQAYEGSYSYLYTKTSAAGAASNVHLVDTGADMHGLLAGVEYTLEAWVYVPTGTIRTGVLIRLQDDNGGLQATSSGNPSANDVWEKLTVTRTMRADATRTYVTLRLDGTVDNNDVAYWDNVRLYPTNYQNDHENCLDDDGTGTIFG